MCPLSVFQDSAKPVAGLCIDEDETLARIIDSQYSIIHSCIQIRFENASSGRSGDCTQVVSRKMK